VEKTTQRGVLFSLPTKYSGDQIKKNEMGGACGTYWERSLYRVLVGRPRGKGQLGRSRHGWKCNIKMELEEVRWGGMDWTDVAADSGRCRVLVLAGMNLRVP